MIPFFPREQGREVHPRRGGRTWWAQAHPSCPHFVTRNSYLGDSPFLFCVPSNEDPADDRMGGEKPVEMRKLDPEMGNSSGVLGTVDMFRENRPPV